jgi:hypothetical protein
VRTIARQDSYRSLRELKELADWLHESCLQQGNISVLDQVVAIELTTDRLRAELERHLRPECDPDSAYAPAMADNLDG